MQERSYAYRKTLLTYWIAFGMMSAGSWLNMAEIELSVLSAQCLDRRIADIETFQREMLTWQEARNAATNGADWQFTTENARIKLKRLYPQC